MLPIKWMPPEAYIDGVFTIKTDVWWVCYKIFYRQNILEVARQTESVWGSYWSMKDLLKGDVPLYLKRWIMDMCILPILTYGAQTWFLTLQQRSKFDVCQRAIFFLIRNVLALDHHHEDHDVHCILEFRLSDRVRNTTLRSKTRKSLSLIGTGPHMSAACQTRNGQKESWNEINDFH